MNMNVIEKDNFKTKGKNREMLRQLKIDLKQNVQVYCRSRKPFVKRLAKEEVGRTLSKIAELSTIKYFKNTYDVEEMRGDVTLNLWRIIENKKFNKNKLKNETSTYSFFMMSAKNFCTDFIRKDLRRRGIVNFYSLEKIKEMSAGQEIQSKSFFPTKSPEKPKRKRTVKNIK